jgi:hypothetical protein
MVAAGLLGPSWASNPFLVCWPRGTSHVSWDPSTVHGWGGSAACGGSASPPPSTPKKDSAPLGTPPPPPASRRSTVLARLPSARDLAAARGREKPEEEVGLRERSEATPGDRVRLASSMRASVGGAWVPITADDIFSSSAVMGRGGRSPNPHYGPWKGSRSHVTVPTATVPARGFLPREAQGTGSGRTPLETATWQPSSTPVGPSLVFTILNSTRRLVSQAASLWPGSSGQYSP